MTDTHQPGQVRTAVITGMHPYDVPAFYRLFKSMPAVDSYPQNLWDFAASPPEARAEYEVLVFYNFHPAPPEPEAGPWDAARRAALESLGQNGQGLLLLHHALLAFRGWSLWDDLVGVRDRGFGFYPGEELQCKVAAPGHPIVQGLSSWTLVDETYTMGEPGPDSEVLITTEHPRSMKNLAWTRQFRNSRVFCYESGHDNVAWTTPEFHTVVERGIQWLAGRI